VDFFQDPEII